MPWATKAARKGARRPSGRGGIISARMSHPWLIVLAPESKVRSLEDLETLPPMSSDRVAAALKQCPFLGTDGVRYKTSVADGFELPPEGVSFIPMAEVDDPIQIV